MSHNRRLVDILPISYVASYMLELGWQRVGDADSNPLVFTRTYNGDTPLLLVLPAHKDMIDADRRLHDVVRSLATLESKSPRQMAQKLIVSGLRRRSARGKVKRAPARLRDKVSA